MDWTSSFNFSGPLKPLGFEGEYVFVQRPGPHPQAHRVYRIWSRWLDIHRHKTQAEFDVSDGRFIPLIHQDELDGFPGSDVHLP